MSTQLRPHSRSFRAHRPGPGRGCFFATAEGLERRELLAVYGPWSTYEVMPAIREDLVSYIQPRAAKAFTIDQKALATLLSGAPLEFTAAAAAPLEFAVPMPDGRFNRFAVVEAPIMDPGLAAQFPDIKTYRGQGIDDPASTIRFDVTPLGFHAQILSPSGASYIDPYYHLDTSLYVSYYKRDLPNIHAWECHTGMAGDEAFGNAVAFAAPADFIGPLVPGGLGAADADHSGCGCPLCQASVAAAAGSGEVSTAGVGTAGGPSLLKSGTQLRSYRTVVAATGEYTAFHGGTVAAGQAAIVTAMNRVNQVYENDLSIRMVLVANNSSVVYTNAATDPYTNNNGVTMLSQNQTNLDAVIGNANYDIGHVFSTGGGGVASLASVGVNSIKARGVTGLPSPTGDPFYIDYVAHEMGHQYGGNHTFNTPNAGGNRNAATAYEPGSGSTIMAYAGITGADDLQSFSDPYFHFISLQEILNHVDVTISSVGTRTATGNTVPTVTAMPSTYAIPTGTPFVLSATGSDSDGDTVTYSWEQRDLGLAQNLSAADNGSSPLFRVWNPTTSGDRTLPRLSNLLNNTLPVGEKLPAVARSQMKFRVVARDNRSGGGGIEWADTFVQVVNTGAAFAVTAPNTAVTWNAGTTQTVTWNVAGTTAAPISTNFVNIRLSVDGGITYPFVLATNAANDGSQDVPVPALNTTQARIKVEAVDNIYFDISNANFTITNADTTPPTVSIVPVLPVVRNFAVSGTVIAFSEPVTGFDLADLTLTRNGSPVSLAGATLTGGSQNYTLENLSSVTTLEGTYVLTLVAAGSGIIDAAGNPLGTGSSISWVMDTTAPTVDVVDVSPDPRNTSVSSIAINFSEPVGGFFRLSNIEITRNGVGLSTGGLWIEDLGTGANYRLNGLSSLTTPEGTYVVTILPTGITDTAGNPLAGAASDTWVMDTTRPTGDVIDVTPDPRNTSVSSIAINFSEPVTGVAVGSFSLFRNGSPVSLAGASVSGSGSNYSLNGLGAITAAQGTYSLVVNGAGSTSLIFDLAGNLLLGTPSDSWVMDTTAPTVDIIDVTPDPRSTPVPSITIVFSEPVTGFDLADLTFTRNGGPNLLTGAQTLTTGDNTTFTLNNLNGLTTPDGFYSLTLAAPGGGITDLAGNPINLIASNLIETFTVQTTLVVTSWQALPGGIRLNFNKPIDPVPLNLYDTAAGALGPADVTLVGSSTGPVVGSLVVAPDGLSVTFVKTGAPLTAQNYTVTLRSAANGFKGLDGGLLDGNADGTTGDNYTLIFNPPLPGSSRTISLPDFARGPGQPVDVPATATGLPVSISDGTGVTSISLRINYDPALLTLTAAGPGPDAPGGASVTLDTTTPGYALLTYSGPALPSGLARFATLTASVPTTAPYAAKQALVLTDASINGGAINPYPDTAVHVIGYLGDASGNGTITGLDATLTNRIAASIDAGFAGFQAADPVIVADVNGSGNITGLDATLINRFAASIPTPQIPAIPNVTLAPAGLDPRVSLPRGLVAAPGGTLSVPVRVENTDRVAVGLEAFDLAIALDPSAFEVRAVRADGHDLAWSFDRATGLLMITAARPDGAATLRPGESVELARIELAIRPGASAGARALNLLGSAYANGAPRATALNEGKLVLIPAPTNAADDPVDGQVVINRARQADPAAVVATPWVVTPPQETAFLGRSLSALGRRGRARVGR